MKPIKKVLLIVNRSKNIDKTLILHLVERLREYGCSAVSYDGDYLGEGFRDRIFSLPEDAPVLLMSTAKGLAPLAYGVTGARVLHSTSWAGAILHMVGGGLGLAVMLTLVILGALQLISPMNMFLYQLIWMIPALLITEWTRVV